MQVYNSQAETCRWIFGYGSLMWLPGFTFERNLPARISGYHRRLSVYSNHYRGTPEKPGLVFGLDRGGSCAGMAFEVSEGRWSQTATRSDMEKQRHASANPPFDVADANRH